MKKRCAIPSASGYRNYGGRGIRVCERWRESFLAFLDDVGCRPTGRHSLDRIDTNGNYEPGNVRWATTTEQATNCRRNRRLTHDGKTQTLVEWARDYQLNPDTLASRIGKLGWSMERALAERPVRAATKAMGDGRL
jgi:hypothetical protein